MAVRNCGELGKNLQKIIRRLLANDDLVKLLYYEDTDPLTKPNLEEKQKEKEIFEKLIKSVPRVGTKDTAKSIIVVYVQKGSRLSDNKEFRDIRIAVDIIVPLTQCYIDDSNLRPFAIMGKIQESLDGKTINGLGKIVGGDFELNFVTDDVICYNQTYRITEYA